MSENTTPGFSEIALQAPLLKALKTLGYEQPTAIQAQAIPLLLDGRDLLGQAQTGTGKTAAFALPLLSRLDLKLQAPQVLVLTPTRELAIQVAEAFKSYASQMKNFRVLPVYGGQEYGTQIRAPASSSNGPAGFATSILGEIITTALTSLPCLIPPIGSHFQSSTLH